MGRGIWRRKTSSADRRGRVRGGRRRDRICDAGVGAHGIADDRCPLLDPRASARRRGTSCSCRSTTRRFQELTNAGLYSELPFPRRYDAACDRPPAASRREGDRDGHPIHAADRHDRRQRPDRSDRQGARENRARHHRSGTARQQRRARRRTSLLRRTWSARGGGDLDDPTATARCGASLTRTAACAACGGDGRSRAQTSGPRVAVSELARCRSTSSGPPETFTSISYSKVLNGRSPHPGLFANKIVIVGASAPMLQDVHATATTGSATMSGTGNMGATRSITLLQGVPLRDAPAGSNVVLIVAARAIARRSAACACAAGARC